MESMKILILFVMLFEAFNIRAQVNCGQIISDSKSKLPIPFAIIKTSDKTFYTDSLGYFQVDNQVNSNKIIVSCLGYESKTVIVNCKESIIFLKQKAIILPEIKVSPKPTKTKNLGVTEKTKISVSGLDGSIISVFIPNETSTHKVISKIVVPYKAIKHFTSSFRFHIYKISNDGKPGSEMIERNLVGYPIKKKGKIEIDVKEYNLEIPKEGIFIGIEWISSDNPITDKKGNKLASDIAVFMSKKLNEKYQCWEKRVANESDWKPFSLQTKNKMSINVGLIVNEQTN
jgi:hypothetical protein